MTISDGEAPSSQPGRVITTGLKVVNRIPTRHRFWAQAILPAGWRSVMPDSWFEIAAGGTDVQLVGILVPADARSGDYPVRCVVSDDAIPPCRTVVEFKVRVLPLRGLDLKVLAAPRFVIAGTPQTATFLLTNRGNEPGIVRLMANDAEGFQSKLDRGPVPLGPGNSRTIPVTIVVDPSLTRNLQQVLELHAVLTQDTTVRMVASFPMQLIAPPTETESRFHQLPVEITLRGAGEDGTRGGQLEIAGGGTVADSGDARMEFLLRTPDIQSKSILGLRDEYRWSYLSDRYAVLLGDRNYDLSPLTEAGRYAFGAGGRLSLGDVTAGGFVNQTRFYSPVQKEEAGFLSYGFAPASAIGVNYLWRRDISENNVATVRGQLRPFGQNDVDLEYGVSSPAGDHNRAFAGRIQASEPWISYDLRYVHAGTDFGGYYRDVDFKNASLNVRPWQGIRFEGYAREESRNLLRDTSLAIAPRERSYQAGVGYREYFAVYFRLNDDQDLMPVSKYWRRESSVLLQSSVSSSGGSIAASTELGRSREYLLNSAAPFRRFQLSSNVRPDAHQTYGVSVEYSKEQDLSSGTPAERWSGGLSAGIVVGVSTHFLASLYETRTTTPAAETYTLGELTIRQELPWGHTVALRARESIFSPQVVPTETAYVIEYSVPVSLPLTRRSTAGVLTGRVVDAGTLEGIAGVILNVGNFTTVTDNSGGFQFPALKPGSYDLQADLGSLGLDRVTTEAVPFHITLIGGEETRVDLRVTRGATVTGTVTIFDFPEKTDSTHAGLLQSPEHPTLVAELSREQETLRSLTDNEGMFRFANIRPGAWTLKILADGLPAYHTLEQDSTAITLGPGETRAVALRVVPVKRNIQILQEQTLTRQEQPPVTPQVVAKTLAGGCLIIQARSNSGFLVQESSWRTRAKAARVASVLAKKTGIIPTINYFPTGHFRVRFGPFTSRAEALAFCARLGKL